jgi:hypothetical protein
MKTIKLKLFVSISLMLLITFGISAQQPYKINPANGLPLLDGSNNPIRDDKNYIPTPAFSNDFIDEASTRLDFQYGSNLNYKELSYIVLEDMGEDNCYDDCFIGNQTTIVCNNGSFFGNSLPYPIAHTYQLNGSINTVKLIMKKYNTDFIEGWYKDGSCDWDRLDKKFSYTKGELISKKAFKYGYFEARFKVNRPAGISNIGLGQCFWLFPIKEPNNIPNFEPQYCYSEIDIAENQPHHGIMGFGALVSQTDVDCQGQSNPPKFVTSECECNFFGKACADQIAALFHKRNIAQEEFHTYAVEWTPSSLKYFYDNELITTINNLGPNGKIPENMDPMGIIFDIEGGTKDWDYHGRCSDIGTNTIFPFEFEIDYVKQYKLDLSDCNTPLPTIYTQTDFNLFSNNPKVKHQIKVGEEGVNYPILVNAGANVSLRAAYLLELNEGFEIDVNGEFFADVIGGCDEGF